MKDSLEGKQFCKINTLMTRWECSRGFIYDMVSQGALVAWHPKGQIGSKGLRIAVKSIFEVEKNGYIDRLE